MPCRPSERRRRAAGAASARRGSRRASAAPAGTRRGPRQPGHRSPRSEEHTSELQSHSDLVCRLLLEKKKKAQEDSNKRTTRRKMWSVAIRPTAIFFLFNDTAATEIYTLSLHDALPTSPGPTTTWAPLS